VPTASMRRSRFSLSLGLIVAVLLAVAMCGAASPASALEWNYVSAEHWVNVNGKCQYKVNPLVGKGCFEADGDRLQINDMARDSHRTGVQWKTTGGRAGVCVNTHGIEANALQASYPYVTGGYSCHKDFPRGNSIRIRSGACNGSNTDCGVLANWVQWSAWSDWLPVGQ
jgi:hypothetical protein